jgi:hypothetical protein
MITGKCLQRYILSLLSLSLSSLSDLCILGYILRALSFTPLCPGLCCSLLAPAVFSGARLMQMQDIRYFLWEHSIPFIETSARSGHHVADVFLRRGLLDSYRHRDAPPLLETQQPPEGM